MSFEYSNKITYIMNNEKVSSLDYYIEKGILYITGVHTDPLHQGKGYARIIVDEIIDYARKNNYKVMPICPYVVSIFDKEDFSSIDARKK